MFGKKKAQSNSVMLPPLLQAEDAVNYNSVLDWLLGLSDKDYKIMLEVVSIFRTANKSSAKLLKIKDQPTSQLIEPQQTEAEEDADLDLMIESDSDDLTAALLADTPKPKPQKPQSPKK